MYNKENSQLLIILRAGASCSMLGMTLLNYLRPYKTLPLHVAREEETEFEMIERFTNYKLDFLLLMVLGKGNTIKAGIVGSVS